LEFFGYCFRVCFGDFFYIEAISCINFCKWNFILFRWTILSPN